MNWELTAEVLGAFAALLVAWRAFNASSRKRALEELKLELDVLEKLPESMESRQAVVESVDEKVRQTFEPSMQHLADLRSESTWGWGLFLILVVVTAYLAVSGSQWWILSAFFTVSGFSVAKESSKKAEKFETGLKGTQNRVEAAEPPSGPIDRSSRPDQRQPEK